jgi:hypothetical protein
MQHHPLEFESSKHLHQHWLDLPYTVKPNVSANSQQVNRVPMRKMRSYHRGLMPSFIMWNEDLFARRLIGGRLLKQCQNCCKQVGVVAVVELCLCE